LIHGFCQVGDLDAAQDLLNEMISCGVAPDYITFHCMLAGLCSKKELRKAFAILEDLQKSEVCPRLIFFLFSLCSFILGFGEVCYRIVQVKFKIQSLD